ncbi:MAG: transposase, partial [Polyangiaceae bacterium]|nr:transposase [Polyangiaceae bacterium]
MANLRMAARRLLNKYELEAPDDFVREMLELAINALMDAEVTAQIGAGRYERSEDRTTWRNGNRSRRWDTRVGTVDLEIPKLRDGSYYPSFLESRRRSERALLAVIQEAYVDGVSTRKVDRLAKALGIDGISRSQVSRICAELDELVEAWRNRRLEEPIVYMWLDATFPKVRENG